MPQHLYILQIAANFLAIVLGPVTAVSITLWMQGRKDKRAAKRSLFLTLMGERKALVISREVAQALNTIDVVFSGCHPVINVWHRYYLLLSQPPSQERVHIWLELLTEMASDLDYDIKQTNLDKFYLPQGHADELEFQQEIGKEWLRVLKSTNSLGVEIKPQDVPG